MPLEHGEDVDLFLSNPIDEAIRLDENLPHVVAADLTDHVTSGWEARGPLCGGKQLVDPSSSRNGVIGCDVVVDLFEIQQRAISPIEPESSVRWGPRAATVAYREARARRRLVISATTAACERTRPASESTSPASTAAANRARSLRASN